MDFLEQLLGQLQAFLAAIGPAGLLALAFLDSAGVPTLGGPDVVLLLMAPRYSGLGSLGLWLISVAGSALGSLVLYGIGRKGGGRFLSRFGGAPKQEWVRRKMGRYDFAAILTATLGPPPYPTKLFILSAGVLRMKWQRLLAAVVLGRLLRYGVAGYLGFHYGDRAAALLREYYPALFLAVLALLALALWRQYRRG